MPNVYTKYITAQPSPLLLPSANFSLPLNIEEECDAGRSVPSIFRRYIRTYGKLYKPNV